MKLSMNPSEVPKIRILLYLPNDNYEETLVVHYFNIMTIIEVHVENIRFKEYFTTT